MLKTVVPLHIFEETVILWHNKCLYCHFWSIYSWINQFLSKNNLTDPKPLKRMKRMWASAKTCAIQPVQSHAKTNLHHEAFPNHYRYTWLAHSKWVLAFPKVTPNLRFMSWVFVVEWGLRCLLINCSLWQYASNRGEKWAQRDWTPAGECWIHFVFYWERNDQDLLL